MVAEANIARAQRAPCTSTPRIVPLWRDKTRVEQLARLRALELQAGDDYGQRAWDLAHEQWRQLPEWARIDLPSPHVFGRILGLFRTGATLKTGKLLRLELSAEEIADLLGYSKTTVEAALRWLGSGPIEHHDDHLARGLGLVHRGRRTAWAFLEGQMRRVYRTSRTILTMLGRMLLGLGPRDEERAREQHIAKARAQASAKTPAPALAPAKTAEQEHVEGLGSDGGKGDQPPAAVEGASQDVGREWLRKIQSIL